MTKTRMISSLIGLCALLAPLGFSVSANAQQSAGIINGPTRVEKANIRQEFNSEPIIPSDVMKPYLRGVELFKSKDYSASRKSFRQVLRYNPDHAKTNYYMGAILASQGKDMQAIGYYRKSLKGYETNPIIQAKLGVSYVNIEKREKAKSILKNLKIESASCGNSCANSEMIADAIHVLSEALYVA